VQEALLAAATQWPANGVPESPRAWLVRVAVRRLTDHVRADAARRSREQLVVSLVPAEDQLALAVDEEDHGARDDTLELLFLCCHPALSATAAIALTLRAVGGLTTQEIARAFLVPEATMAQRISRAKQAVKDAGATFEASREERAARLGSVMHVLYLIFNEGYAASSGAEVERSDLAHEATRLARLLLRVAPDEAEAGGLLALMLFTDARRAARTSPSGALVPLDEQDRSAWDASEIAEATALLAATLASGVVGPYQLQAAIAALHDEAKTADATDWPQILALYDVLLRVQESPMAALSHAIATAMVHGPAAGLARLDAIARAPALASSHRLDAARAHLLEKSGDLVAAIARYKSAAARTASEAERDYLLTRAARAAEALAATAPPRTP
ncbi:MAG TPA: DUF6596 domain-containing protein, partial [Byssovorax sp.]|jgi:predicted RNA polymerase sigma factor